MIKSSMALTFAERRRSMAALMAMLLATVVEVDAQPTTITPPTNAGDSVYTSTAGGFATLTAWNQVALIATIVVFLLLSALSGHEVYRIRYGRVLATNANANSKTTNANSTTNASTSITNNGTKLHPNYTTPKHGLATPVSAIDHTSDGTDDSAGAALSTGAEMRLRFFVLLFLASTIRVVSLIVEITTLKAMVASPAASLYSRLLSMFMWIPALLFVSMYGLVLLFWAQLCYACWGKAYPWPRRVFFVFNVVLYVVFVLLLFATSTSGSFWRACDLMLGAIYAVGLVGIVYYSVRLIQFFQQRGPDEEFFFDLPHTKRAVSPRQIVLRRIMAVCGLLSVLFVVKAAYLIGLGIGFVPSEETQYRSPVGVHHLAFEFTMHFFTEFVPCALLLVATRKQSHAASAAAASATGSLHATTPGVSGSYPHGLPSGSHSFVGLRGRNNSSHSAYQDDTQSVGSGSLTGYQFQAVQRSYGAGSFGSVQRATNAAYQSLDHSTTTSNGTTATSSSGVTSYA